MNASVRLAGSDEPVRERDTARPAAPHGPTREHVAGVDIDSLPIGTQLLVTTHNSSYHLTVVDPAERRVLIAGGAQFSVPRLGWVEGTWVGGGVMSPGHLQVGLPMALFASEQPIVTSRVYSVAIERPVA
jgi:hypothetical protein